MKKKFNITGVCYPHLHYMMDISQKMRETTVMVEDYFQHRYIIELKRWYGAKVHQAGLDQLANYLAIHSVNKGYLVIFETRKKKT